MNPNSSTRKIAFLGDFPPRQCGIATFTRDLRQAIMELQPDWTCPVLAVTDGGRRYDYPEDVRFEFPEKDAEAYVRAADFLNVSHANALCVQHEFGIYGGPAGRHLISLLRRVRMPVVTTLHTILREPDGAQRKVFHELVQASTRLVTMTAKGAELLRGVYQVPEKKIAIIPHGIPDAPFVDPNFHKDQFGVAGRPVILTFGLLSPGKGIEYGISALPEIVREHPGVVYIVLGATHPNLVRAEGETYRLSLERLAKKLGVENNVIFVNRYVDNRALSEYIGVADIYLTPYLNEAQITSGTLAYCYGAGKAVISTPYWHAAELLGDGRGMLVPFRDAGAIARAANQLLGHEACRHAMRKQAYLAGRDMIWKQVAHDYSVVFNEAIDVFRTAPPPRASQPAMTLAKEQAGLPLWRFDHLLRLSDSTGVFQHAIHCVPWFEHGYCIDDNARALLLTVSLEPLEETTPALEQLQTATAAFIQHAYNAGLGRFRNFMSFDRRWLEDAGSDDSHGRALWALGAVVGRTRREGLRHWAAALFERALPAMESSTSPRAWAFAVLGVHEYLRVFQGDLLATRWRTELAGRLLALYERVQGPDWRWLENIVSYDNARIPHALILSGYWMSREDLLRTGLDSLRWLQEHQTGPSGFYRPVGSEGFWPRGQAPALFDQQPVEAAAAVSACIEAWHATGDSWWCLEAQRSFEWFLGGNDSNLPLYDATTGGCFDGLHANRVNQNQGAESTVSFLLALAEMKALNHEVLSFSDVVTSS